MPQLTVDDGVSLYFRELGEGPRTVVLVHGSLAAGVMWEDVAPLVARAGVRVLVPDLRGTGSSDKPASGYTIERNAADLLALLAYAGPGAVLVGHSLGGLYAQYAAALAPPQLKGLALVCPMPADGTEVPIGIDLVFQSAATDADARRTMLTLAARALPDTRLDAVVNAGLSTLPRAFRAGLEAIQSARFADRLARIEVPTVVVSADDAYVPDVVLRQRVTSRIPRATQVFLPGCGHYAPLERPGELAAILGAFVAGLG